MNGPFPTVAGVDVEHEFVQARGLRFHVAMAGPRDAPVLLLLHGWPQHWYMWRKVLPDLARDHRVVMPDLRGFGWSDAPPDGYDKESLATDALAILDELGLDRVSLLGHDWGGWAGFLMLLREPERFERAVLLCIPPPFSGGRPQPRDVLELWRLWYQVALAAPWLGTRFVRSPRLARVLRAGNVQPGAISAPDAEVFAASLREPARARASQLLYRTFLTRDLGWLLRGRYDGTPLRVPTLLLIADRDPVVRYDNVTRAQRPGDELTIEKVDASGHFLAEELPELVAGRTRAWVSIAGDDDRT